MRSPGRSVRVLVVDDECSVADTLALILNRSGHESIAVYSAAEAVSVAGSFKPHALLSDVMMPGMNGFELAALFRRKLLGLQTAFDERARQRGGYRTGIPRGPISSKCSDQAGLAADDSGFRRWLCRESARAGLKAHGGFSVSGCWRPSCPIFAIGQRCQPFAHRTLMPRGLMWAAQAQRKNPTILFVDDDPFQALVYTAALEGRFHPVRRVADAVEALCLVEDPESHPIWIS